MRPYRSNGRTGTPTIPDGWGASHATVLDTSRTAIISLTDGNGVVGTPVWDPDTEKWETPANPDTPYASSVPASIVAQQSTGDPRVEAAGETLDVFDYLIGVDHGQDTVREGHVATVTACEGDPALVGRSLRVERVEMGAERFERVLYCTLNDDRAEAPA